LTGVIGLAGIAAVVLFLDPARVGSALEHFQLLLIAPIVLLSVVVYILQGIRWHYLLTDVGTRLRLRDTILINLAGQTITAIVPLGDLTRAAFASTADGTDFGTVAATVTVQELSYMLWLILSALPAILALGYGLAAVVPVAVGIALIVVVLTVSPVFCRFHDLVAHIPFLNKLLPAIDELQQETSALLHRLLDDPLRELVGRQAPVAVLPARLGRDDVRGVAGDQVELLACDRVEQAPEPRFDVPNTVHRGIDLGKRECAMVHVGCDHVVAVRGCEQCVDPVPGSDVERARCAAARCEGRKPRCRRRVRRDESHRVVDAAGETVERHQELLGGHDPRARPEQGTVDLGEPQRDQRVERRGRQRCPGCSQVDRQLQQAEPHARGERRVVEPSRVHGHLVRICARPVFTEQLDDGFLVVACRAQRVAERLGRAYVCDRVEAFAAQAVSALSGTRRGR